MTDFYFDYDSELEEILMQYSNEYAIEEERLKISAEKAQENKYDI